MKCFGKLKESKKLKIKPFVFEPDNKCEGIKRRKL